MKHLLAVEHLDRADIERIAERAESFAEVGRRDIKKVPTLRGRTIVHLFYESSTRTSSSFELAAKRLSADVVSIRAAGSGPWRTSASGSWATSCTVASRARTSRPSG